MSDRDPYRLLGIEPTATPAQIRAAFRRLVRERHPDTGSGADVGAVIDAYHLLIDQLARARYDAGRSDGVPAHSRPPHQTEARPPCPICRGNGALRSANPCPACAGSGAVTSLEPRRARHQTCHLCAGRGRTVTVTRCPTCGGTGMGDPT